MYREKVTKNQIMRKKNRTYQVFVFISFQTRKKKLIIIKYRDSPYSKIHA